MASPEAMGSYYEGYPDPDDAATWGTDPEGNPYSSFEDSQAGVEAAQGPPPTPDPVPGAPSPGAGMPAARVADLCAHGGVILPPGAPTVLIGFMPAARMMDLAACPMFNGVVPHVTGTILKGSSTVMISYMNAARVADPIGPPAVCAGNQVALGCMTVLIGDSGGGGGGGGGAGGGGGGGGGGGAATAESESSTSSASEAGQSDAASGGEGGAAGGCTNPACHGAFAQAAQNGTALVDRQSAGC